MWRLWNKLFGWDYILWTNTATSDISRVHITPDSKVFYYLYSGFKYNEVIRNKSQVIWLTCLPSKYGF